MIDILIAFGIGMALGVLAMVLIIIAKEMDT